MLVSVGVTIYRRRHAVPSGSPIGEVATRADQKSCFDELSDVVEGLQKYLENSHHLLAHYDAAKVQQWADDGGFWRGQWKAAGERCGFERRKGIKGWEEMAVLHEELKETEAVYTKEILRFGRDPAPRLDRIRERLEKMGARMALPPEPGDRTP